MTKVTKKLQVSVPKTLADQYGIRPGDDLAWEAAGDVLRVIPPDRDLAQPTRYERLWLFDQASERQRQREVNRQIKTPSERGWSRDSLYDDRGHAG